MGGVVKAVGGVFKKGFGVIGGLLGKKKSSGGSGEATGPKISTLSESIRREKTRGRARLAGQGDGSGLGGGKGNGSGFLSKQRIIGGTLGGG